MIQHHIIPYCQHGLQIGSMSTSAVHRTLDDIIHFYYYLRLYIDYYERIDLEDEYNFSILHTKFNIITIA